MNILKVLKKQTQQQSKSFTPRVPSGLIAHTEKGYYYIKGAKRFKFVSEKAMHTWGLGIIKTTEAAMINFPIVGSLGLRDGTLAKDISDGRIYLISDSKRRHIVDPDVLEWINLKTIIVGQKEIDAHTEGEPLNGNNT